MSITSSTLFATKAQQTIENMPGMVKESGIARQQAYGKNCTWDAGVDQDEQFVKSEITWEGERCVKIVLNKGNICWYLLETIACEELKEEPEDEADNEVEDWDEAERGGNRKRIKIRAVSREMAEHEHRYGDVDMEAM
ncbi:hypothetical protein G6011_06244 [Alternaria panax]|uniref:Uncharacterized protein n=1 Tax=Alternaria panax TaxID=48097 RepID=A0AAD4FIN7_9PLEO|nr:hypothetical protein G6011_06244 [Alternaria panax]